MKHKLFELYKKYKLSIIISLSIIVVGLICIILFLTLNNKSSILEYKNNNYIVKYDNTWNISSKSDNKIILKHDKESKLSIEIIELQEEYKYSTIDDMLEELLYVIEQQNENYKLLYKEKDSITKNKYEGYRLLYEDLDTQTLVVVAKKSDKMIIFIYEANNNYFDILLDSVQNIIYDFDTIEEEFSLAYNLNIETQSINYYESNTITSMLSKTTQYDIANYNYYVKYSIPSNFKLNKFDSTYGAYSFDGIKDSKITLNINIKNKNIYEQLDKEKTFNVYSNYKSYKTDEDYSKFTESLDKFDSDFESYIYKCSFYYDKALTFKNSEMQYKSKLEDHVILLYALDTNHILEIKIESSDVAIPKELIDMIKIDNTYNYSSYSNSTKENGMIKSNFKRMVGLDNKIDEITLSIPDKYKEVDKQANLYSKKNYGLNYDDKYYLYDYEIEYSLTTEYREIESEINSINSWYPKGYGEYKELKYSGKKNINGKEFIIYDGGYTDISGIMFTSINRKKYYVNLKVLFYKLDNGGYLVLKIEGNGNKISDETLNELTNFEIKK